MQSNNGQQALETMEKGVEEIRYTTSETKIVDYDIGEYASRALDRYEQDFKEDELISTAVEDIDFRFGGGFSCHSCCFLAEFPVRAVIVRLRSLDF